MPYSIVSHTATGLTDTFNVTFPYLSQGHVKVYVAGVLKTAITDYTWLSTTAIKLTVMPSRGQEVLLKRDTPKDAMLVEQQPSLYSHKDANQANLQLLYVEQEALDAREVLDAELRDMIEVASGFSFAANAEASAVLASVAEDQATAAASSAAANAATVTAIYDNFDDRYLGAKTSEPTLDNDGNTLITGALFYHTEIGMKQWGGASWIPVAGAGTPLLAANNLSDLANAATARTNLGLLSAAQRAVGTAVGNVVEVVTGGKLPVLDASNLTAIPAPVALSTASGAAPSYSARAWVNFNGTGTVAIRASGNVSSITDNGVGDYTVNATTAQSDANYSVFTSGNTRIASASENSVAVLSSSFSAAPLLKSTSQVRIGTGGISGVATLADLSEVYVGLMR